MSSKFKSFKNWDSIDVNEYLFLHDQKLKFNEPEQNMSNISDRNEQPSDELNDFQKSDAIHELSLRPINIVH